MRRSGVLIVATAWALLAGSAPGADHAPAAATQRLDTTPPVPFIRARTRQDLHDVLRRGIQTTCGTEDDERPVVCAMSASRRGHLLTSETDEIVAPYNRFHFELELSASDRHRIRRAEPPIVIKLELEVSDEAGNVGTDQKRIRLVRDLFGRR